MARGSTCGKCGGRMEQGYSLDHTDGGGRKVATWIEGAPEKGWFGNVSIRRKRRIEIEAWRCQKCGFLENYAPGQ